MKNIWLLDELESMQNSDMLAVKHRDEFITYKDLWLRSEAMANYFNKSKLNKKPLLIYGNKEIDFIVCMHAALKVGIPYVPIDILYPKERVQKIAEIVDADIVVNLSNEINIYDKELNIKDVGNIYNAYAGKMSNKSEWVKDKDVCYILFTSGSTGEPKGVPINKENLVNFINWFKMYMIEEGVSVLNQAPYSFDLSVIGLFVGLSLGKTLVNIDKEMTADFDELLKWLNVYKPDIWISTPSFMNLCIYQNNFFNAVSTLRNIIFDGEVLTKNLASNIFLNLNNVRLVNAYGPTEATVAITACDITQDMLIQDDNLPIGKVLNDGVIELKDNYIDDYGNDVGELWIKSKSVAEGYYKNQENTQKSFIKIENEYNQYNTGDFVYEKNGLIYYVGRRDFQIKLNGYRIELNDINANLLSINIVKECIVLPVYENNQIKFLAAYVVLNDQTQMSGLKTIIFLKKALRKKIPEYMIPRKIKIISSMPLNINGKIDRKRLLEDM